MQIDIITLFPKMFEGVLRESILKRSQERKIVSFSVVDLRNFATDKHRKADDRPFGGGPGMVMKAEPIFRAVETILDGRSKVEGGRKNDPSTGWVPPSSFHLPPTRIILMTPQGKKLTHVLAERLVKYEHLILICGHYEGVDERVRKIIDEEVSIGDYILTGGELPAMVVIDAVVRLIPGVLGDEDSPKMESFHDGLLEYPQYTRPAEFCGMKIPKVLLTGDHQAIQQWRMKQSLLRTKQRRPDLI